LHSSKCCGCNVWEQLDINTEEERGIKVHNCFGKDSSSWPTKHGPRLIIISDKPIIGVYFLSYTVVYTLANMVSFLVLKSCAM